MTIVHAVGCAGREPDQPEHRHHLHAGARPGPRRRRPGHRVRQQHRGVRSHRRRRRDTAPDRAAGDHLRQRLDRRHRLEPQLAHGVRRLRDRRLVRRLRLRRPQGAGRLGRGRLRPHRERQARGRHRRRLDRRRHRAAAQPRHQARRPRRAAGAHRRDVHPEERHEPGARRLRVRLRAELRRLAAAQPGDAGPGRHRHSRVAGRGAAGQRQRTDQPGIARAERQPWHQHVQHVHRRRRRARDVAPRLPVLRDAVPRGHRPARGLSGHREPHHRVPPDGRRADVGNDHHLERAHQPDPPDGAVLVRQQHDDDLHRLPRSGEAVLPGRLHDGDGRDRAQLRPRVVPARPHAPLRRGPVDGRHLHEGQRRPQGARPRHRLPGPVRRRDQLGQRDHLRAVVPVRAVRGPRHGGHLLRRDGRCSTTTSSARRPGRDRFRTTSSTRRSATGWRPSRRTARSPARGATTS